MAQGIRPRIVPILCRHIPRWAANNRAANNRAEEWITAGC